MSTGVEYIIADTAVKSYAKRFLDVERCHAACQACSQYGKLWICPPYPYNPIDIIGKYSRLLIVGIHITDIAEGTPMTEALQRAYPAIDAVNERLLRLERQCDGMALSFVGGCRLCGDTPCSRPLGKPCRHPDRMRPSLESFGLDVARTSAELLGIEMAWGSNGMAPSHLTLVCALLHNLPIAPHHLPAAWHSANK